MAAYSFPGYQFGASGLRQKYELGGRAWHAEQPGGKSSANKRVGPVKESMESSLSSTPHAPRVKKPLALLKSNVGVIPSTHDLIKQHSFLDEGLIQTLSEPSLAEGRQQQREPPPPPTTKEAWAVEATQLVPVSRRMVKPYRRSKTRLPPEGVPQLDLSRFTEPDSMMEPIELVGCEDVEAPLSSLASWGPTASARLRLAPVLQEQVRPESTSSSSAGLAVQDMVEDSVLQHTSEAHGSGADRLRYVEDKMLSHERGKGSAFVPHSPVRPEPVALFKGGGRGGLLPAARTAEQAFRGHMTIGGTASESSINKRLRFEARVLTQNGRDVHRDLCGFFFISDGSLSVYEFRQIGKKLSALPFILRGAYCHVLGHKKGQPYEINFIRKGATLHFLTSQHPTLPVTVTSKPTLALRITHVDEKAKRDILCEGRQPMECRKIEAYLEQALSSSHERENSLRKTLQGMLCSRLQGRASRSLVCLGRQLARDSEDSGLVSRTQLRQALREYHISLTQEDFGLLWELLCVGGYGPENGEGVFSESCVGALVGEMSEERKSLVRKVFQKLDPHKTGSVAVTEMHKFFSGATHPEVVSGHMTSGQVWDTLFGHLIQDGCSSISYPDFENYYEGVSIETSSDASFTALLKHCWTI